MNTKKESTKSIERKEKIKVIIPEGIKHKIKYSCSQINSNEWSGMIFYDVDGDINDPANMTIHIKEIIPWHKGSGTYTEYDFTKIPAEKIMKIYEDNPELSNYDGYGNIHSHVNMSVFFSGTDTSTLVDMAEDFNFFLSVIVNNNYDVIAKVSAVIQEEGRITSNTKIKGKNGDWIATPLDQEYSKKSVLIYECDILQEVPDINVPDSYKKIIEDIIEEAKPKYKFGFQKNDFDWQSNKYKNNSGYSNNYLGRTYDDSLYEYEYGYGNGFEGMVDLTKNNKNFNQASLGLIKAAECRSFLCKVINNDPTEKGEFIQSSITNLHQLVETNKIQRDTYISNRLSNIKKCADEAVGLICSNRIICDLILDSINLLSTSYNYLYEIQGANLIRDVLLEYLDGLDTEKVVNKKEEKICQKRKK